MSEPFLGEIRIMGFSFAPRGWAPCNGQIMPISQNTALFALIGTYYGGNGQTTFALPNLQGNAVVGVGTSPDTGTVYNVGQTGGEASHTLNLPETPLHTHQVNSSSAAGTLTAPAAGSAFSPDGCGSRHEDFQFAHTRGSRHGANADSEAMAGRSRTTTGCPTW